MLPVSVQQLLTHADPKKRSGIDVTPTGVIAVFCGSVLSVYSDTGKSFEQWFGAIPFGCSITSIAWCKETNSNGECSYILFASSELGDCFIMNMPARNKFCSFNIQKFVEPQNITPISSFTNSNDSYVTCSAWYPSSRSKIYVCTSTGVVLLFSIDFQNANVIWSYKPGFVPSIIRVSPFNDNLIIVANENCQFQVIEVDLNGGTPLKTPSRFIVDKMSLQDIQFFQFYDDIIVFVMSYSIYIYFISKECFVPFLSTGSTQENIVSAFFPDATKENNVILVYQSHCLYIQNDQLDFDKAKSQFVRYLEPIKQTTESILTHATYRNKLYVYGADNTLQLFEFKNNKVWATRVSRSINNNPTDFDVLNGSLALGTKEGVICITPPDSNSCSLTKFIYLALHNVLNPRIRQEISIHKIRWLSKTAFIVSAMCEGHPKVFFIDYFRMKVKSLLKKTIETTTTEPASILVSKNKQFFATLLQSRIIIFFEYINDNGNLDMSSSSLSSSFGMLEDSSSSTFDRESRLSFHGQISYMNIENDDQFRNLKTIFIEDGSIGSFSAEHDHEFWIISHTNKGEKLRIDLKSHELVYQSRLTSFGEKYGKPQICTVIGDYFVVGMHNGNVVLFNWYGSPPVTIQMPQKTPISVIPSLDQTKCFFIDTNNLVSYFDMRKKTFGTNNLKVTHIVPLEERKLLCKLIDREALTIISCDDLAAVSPATSIVLDTDTYLTMPTDKRKIILIKSLTSESDDSKDFHSKLMNWINTASDLNFSFISDLLRPLDETSYCGDTFGANMSVERIKYSLNVLFTALDMTKKEDVRIMKARIAMLLNLSSDAFELLISEPPDSPTFTLNALKASFLNMEKFPEKLDQSIEELIIGEKYYDAIDMMLITKKYKEACELLLTLKQIYFSAVIAKMKIYNVDQKDQYQDIIRIIVGLLVHNKKIKSAACLLISCHMFKEASNILHDGGYMFPSAVVNAMKEDENGNVYFDSSKLVMN